MYCPNALMLLVCLKKLDNPLFPKNALIGQLSSKWPGSSGRTIKRHPYMQIYFIKNSQHVDLFFVSIFNKDYDIINHIWCRYRLIFNRSCDIFIFIC